MCSVSVSRPATPGRRFLLVFAAASVAIFGILLGLNVHVDPHGIFGTGRFPVLTATSRTEKLARLEALSPAPEALILGSSTMMRVDPAVLERLSGFKSFNASVDSAKSEDFLALLEYVTRQLQLKPRLVLVGVSPRTFTEMANEGMDERLLANHRLLRHVPMHPVARTWRRASLYLQTLDWTYVADVFASARASSGTAVPSKYIFTASGFLGIEEPYDRPGDYRGTATHERPGLSRERQHYFEQFLARCGELGADGHVLVTPESPDHIAFQNQQMDGLYDRRNRELVAYLQSLSSTYGFRLHNFDRIEAFGGVHEFMGYNHPSIRNGTLMLEQMFGPR